MIGASISATRRYVSGGTGSARCLRPRSAGDGFIMIIFELALAPGRGVRANQRNDALPVACYRPRRRGTGSFCHETAGSQGRASVSEARNEAVRSAKGGRDRPASVLPGGDERDRECGRWLNNRAENSHQPFRRREGAMSKFRDVKTLQKFASVHASIHNHFNLDRHLNNREIFKQNRAAAMVEWRQLAA